VRTRTINTAIKNLVLIVAGQSNCENVAPTAYTPTNGTVIDNFNVLNGQMYAGADPQLGCTNAPSGSTFGAGNIAMRVADQLITNGKFDRVILVPLCSGGSSITFWDPSVSGTLSPNPVAAMARLAQAGYIPGGTGLTFGFLWMQGESDAGTSSAAYQASYNAMSAALIASGFNGRQFINKETWLSGVVNATTQAAQAALVNGTTKFTGADADSLNAANRQADNTHFNDAGMAALATLTYNAMHATGAPY
jgi:hypothetical protein